MSGPKNVRPAVTMPDGKANVFHQIFGKGRIVCQFAKSDNPNVR